MKIQFIFLLVLSVLTVSCKTNQTAANAEQTDNSTEIPQFDKRLEGKWVLEYMTPVHGKDVKQLYKIQMPYLNFVDENKVAGNNGCNNVSGGYSADGNVINFHTEKFGATRMFCEGVDEQAFLSVLKTVNRYDVTEHDPKLVLISGDIVVMSFKKSEN